MFPKDHLANLNVINRVRGTKHLDRFQPSASLKRWLLKTFQEDKCTFALACIQKDKCILHCTDITLILVINT